MTWPFLPIRCYLWIWTKVMKMCFYKWRMTRHFWKKVIRNKKTESQEHSKLSTVFLVWTQWKKTVFQTLWFIYHIFQFFIYFKFYFSSIDIITTLLYKHLYSPKHVSHIKQLRQTKSHFMINISAISAPISNINFPDDIKIPDNCPSLLITEYFPIELSCCFDLQVL